MAKYLAIFTVVITWASAFTAIRAALAHYPFPHLVLLRFAIATAALIVVWLWRGRPRPARGDLLPLAVAGVMTTTAYPLLLCFGELTVPAGTASILVNLSSVFTVILAAAFLDEHLSAFGWLGIALSFGGAALIALGRGTALGGGWGIAAVVAAAAAQGLQFVTSRAVLRRLHPIDYTIFSIVIGTAFDLFAAGGLAGTVRRAPTAASFLYLIPPTTFVVSWIWLKEIPSPATLVGGAIAIAGVVIVKQFGTRRTPKHARNSSFRCVEVQR